MGYSSQLATSLIIKKKSVWGRKTDRDVQTPQYFNYGKTQTAKHKKSSSISYPENVIREINNNSRNQKYVFENL